MSHIAKAKRILAIVLALVIGLCPCLAVSALETTVSSPVPIVVISGDSTPIVDKNGDVAFSTGAIAEMAQNLCQEGENMTDAVFRIFITFLKYYYWGSLTGNYKKYYRYIYDTLQPVFGDSLLDYNGEPTNGSHIDPAALARMEESRHTDYGSSGSYQTWQYRFFYDWRLDPLWTADELNAYIKDVKAVTGCDKVGVICRCLGGNVFLAYVAKYGMDDICGVGFDGVVVNGSEILSDPVSGKFKFDADAINRLLIDLNAVGKVNVDSAIPAAIDTASKSGVIDFLKFVIKFPNYDRIVKGITSSLSLSSFYTWPNYWAAVKAEDYQTALTYVFGDENSAKRIQYAGLIAKLNNYDRLVRQRIPALMQQINENANLIIISKYGFQCSPITQSNPLVGDQLISAELSSFGATTSTIFEPFSEDYVADATALGIESYISPDRQIDASTCLFPNQTFFIKGSSHSDWTGPEMELMVEVICADRQLTVKDLPEKQFTVYDYETDTAAPMTAENCHCEHWEIDYSERSFNPIVKVAGFVKSTVVLIKVLSAKG